MIRIERRLAVAGALLLAAAPARAQSVADVLQFIVTNQSVQTGDFDRDRAAALAASETISRALLVNLSTLPVTSSSSSFLYRLNPALGTEERATPSFAPFVVERALTASRHRASLGVTFQHQHVTRLDGRNLRDGSLVTTANRFVDEDAPFDVDRLQLEVDASIATLFGSYGVSDRVEIGVAVPSVTLRVRGARVNIYRGQTFTQATASATAVGFADMLVRTKVLLYEGDGARLAAAAAVRLPTGRERDLLGGGTPTVKTSIIGSADGRVVSGHANIGATLGGASRELSYAGALAVAATGRLTASVELVGRWVGHAGELVTVAAPHPRLSGVDTLRLGSTDADLITLSLAPGFKWNPAGTWVVGGSVSVPLTDAGLVSRFVPFFGLDYTY
jgi:hypothetical protein